MFEAEKSESPLLGLRSSRAGVQLEDICTHFKSSDAESRWVNSGAMLADSLSERGYPARGVFDLDFSKGSKWKIAFDGTFESYRNRTARGVDALTYLLKELELQSEVVQEVITQRHRFHASEFEARDIINMDTEWEKP